MLKAKIDLKAEKTKVIIKGEGIDLINEANSLYSGILASVLNKVYKGDLNQMFQALDEIVSKGKGLTEKKMVDLVEKGGN